MKINLAPLTSEEEYDTNLPYLGKDYEDDYEEDDEEDCPGCPDCDLNYDEDEEEDDAPTPFPSPLPTGAFHIGDSGNITVSSSSPMWVTPYQRG